MDEDTERAQIAEAEFMTDNQMELIEKQSRQIRELNERLLNLNIKYNALEKSIEGKDNGNE